LLILFIRYLSRVLPRLMPAEHEFLETLGMRPFFELSPLLCNDFRSNSAWNHAHNVSGAWPALNAAAREALEKLVRVRRRYDLIRAHNFSRLIFPPRRPFPQKNASARSDALLEEALAAPAIAGGSPDDYRILGHNLQA
jgi:hypothetical protein